MKYCVLSLLCAGAAIAQSSPAPISAAACGPNDASLTVSVEQSAPGPSQVEPSKARIYFIKDDGPGGKHQHYVLRVGLEGRWVGAYRENSYSESSVEPGEYHLCANVQSSSSLGSLKTFTHFTAEPSKRYYFRIRFLEGTTSLYPTSPILEFEQVDSDEGQYLVSSFPFGAWQTKK